MNTFMWVVYLIIVVQTSLFAKSISNWQLPFFISDTLQIDFPQDSLNKYRNAKFHVMDERSLPGNLLTIQQSKRWKIIPVDQYVTTSRPLATILEEFCQRDSVQFSGRIRLVNLYLWTDNKPLFAKGRRLNAYTLLLDSTDQVLGDWCWEITAKKRRKDPDKLVIKGLVEKWLHIQANAIQSGTFSPTLYPHVYKRELLSWTNIILFRDGYALESHLTLDFPAARKSHWIRSSTGLYYRKGTHHESIGFTGSNQTWYRRMNERIISSFGETFRFGFNNFDRSVYSHLDAKNMLFLQLSGLFSLEYRPMYHKGFFGAIGISQSFTFLPDVLDKFEMGLSITLGVQLP